MQLMSMNRKDRRAYSKKIGFKIPGVPLVKSVPKTMVTGFMKKDVESSSLLNIK
jgi:hypothetical protein